MKGSIVFEKDGDSHFVVQSDSLGRCVGLQFVDLIIFDEFCTLQSHISTSAEKQ